MSSTGSYAASAVALRAPANAAVAAVILGFFVVAATMSALHKDITQGFDEVAHVSYVAHIQHTGDAWPTLEDMRLLDPQSFTFTGEANYLNHPPKYYALLALVGPVLEGHPGALLAHRLIDIAIVAAGLAALLALGIAARFSREEFYAYAVPLACIPVLVPLAGAVNNDNLAFFGGAVTTLGAWQLLATRREAWLFVALFGVVAASWAKLTGLLLTVPMLAGVLGYLLWRRRLTFGSAADSAAAIVLAATPYLEFVVSYGSPTPETPAQIALITDGARAAGWSELPRASFPGYVVVFVADFVRDWMPALGPRSLVNYLMLIVPVLTLGCAFVGIALSCRRLSRGKEKPLDVIVVAGTLAIAATFAIHVSYSYGRYAATGWLMDAYPRYYLPLAAVVPLACLSLLAAMPTPRRRNALVAFLVAGPIVFRLFGAPLG